ncbi:Uncharacterised protein [Pseudomonas aeruginosa]|nr:Uncharacterised protein [Pseudomonas aeruginosa]
MVWIESITITRGCSWRAVAMMVSMLVSVITLSLSSGNDRRRARIATCCWDSSPVTYSAGTRLARLQRVCRRMVDLPMPGSPPISTTEPSTRPPPRTRSSSVEPVVKRGISSTLTSARVFRLACWPAQPPRPEPLGAASTTVSTRVFQAPQSAHWPAHFGKVAPHSVQPYMRLALAMGTPLAGKAQMIAAGLIPISLDRPRFARH